MAGVGYPYAPMMRQEEMMHGGGSSVNWGGLGYIPNFVNDALEAESMQQNINMNKAKMQDYTQSTAVANAYASGDKAAIAKVKAQYPSKAEEYEQNKEYEGLRMASTKMGMFKDELQLTPDLTTYNKNKDLFKKYAPDGQVPEFSSDGEYQNWRQQSLSGVAKTKIRADGAMGLWQDAHDSTKTPEERAAAMDLYNEERQKAKDDHAKAIADINKTTASTTGKDTKEGSPNTNDLNAAQAALVGSPYLKDLTPDVPESKGGNGQPAIPYQIKDAGVARNWIAQNTNDLIHQFPKMSRGDAMGESTAEAELMVDTDKDGKKTFNSTAQVAAVNGQHVRVLSFDPKNGYKVRDREGHLSWYKPKGFKAQ